MTWGDVSPHGVRMALRGPVLRNVISERWTLWLQTGARPPGSTCTVLLSLLYIYMPELWFCFGSFLTCFAKFQVSSWKLQKLVLIKGGKSVPAPCGGNRPGQYACSQLLSLVSLSFLHYSTFAFSEGQFHSSFPLLLSFVHLGPNFLPTPSFSSPNSILCARLSFPAPLSGDNTSHRLS